MTRTLSSSAVAVLAALLLAARAAPPQPLRLLNSTVIYEKTRPTTEPPTITSDRSNASADFRESSHSTISNMDSSISTSGESITVSDSYSEILSEPIEEDTFNKSIVLNGSDMVSSHNDADENVSLKSEHSNAEEKSDSDSSNSTEKSISDTTEKPNDMLFKEPIPISRYIPPIDPMKHLLMSEALKGLERAKAPESFNGTIDTLDAEENINNTVKSVINGVTVEEMMHRDGTTERSSEVLDKEVLLSTEDETKDEPLNIAVNSSNFLNDTDADSMKMFTDASSVDEKTENFTTTTTEKEILDSFTTEDSENLKKEAKDTIEMKNSGLQMEGMESDMEKNISRTESTIYSSTTISSLSSTNKNQDELNMQDDDFEIRSADENEGLEFSSISPFESLTTQFLSETGTGINSESNLENMEKNISSVSEIELLNSENSNSENATILASTTFSTLINNSLDDELEFRDIKISPNESKVTYIKPDLNVTEILADDLNDKANDNFDTTISSITEEQRLSTNTKDPETSPNFEGHHSSEALSATYTTTHIPEEKIEAIDESTAPGAILKSDEVTILAVTDDLESIPADENKVEINTTNVPNSVRVDELAHVESDTSENADYQSQSPELQTTISTENTISSEQEHSITTEQESSEVEEQSLPEIQTAKENLSTGTSLSETSEVQNIVTSTMRPSDYGLNFKHRYVSGNNSDTVAAVQFLHYHDKASSEQCFKLVDAHWNYATNLTEENKKKQLEQTLEYSLFHKEAWRNATSFAWKSFNDTLLRRWFKSLSVLGTAALPEEKLNEFNRLKAEMKNTYSTAKICPYVSPDEEKKGRLLKDCSLTLEPDLQRILTKSRNYNELVHVWKKFREAAGKPIREKYLRFVDLSNEAARLNGFTDTGDMWREAYESESFETDLESLWQQLRPLYEHLHAFVRRRLIQEYGSEKIKEDGPIPAHLFGNMWAQSWVSLLDITQPFAGKPSVDVTPVMEAKNLTALEMFKMSEEFFTSLGLKKMPDEFWDHSLIEKPKDREIICHASAWDFCNGKDYRIKQCTDITMEDLITVHHEMGHIQYFLQYARQPNVFREGANPGFHEAIGDVLALSVSTPKHLQSIGLLQEVADDPEGDLNFLLRTALDKVSFLPSGYLIDLWRWGLFSGEIKPEEMNTKWWDLRLKYQGICPPTKRTDADFDPGAKYHVPGNVPYIRYFVSFIVQFQFHKVLCDVAGHEGPLYKCDIYRSKEAGQILSQVMELGSSEHWSEAMKIMTGGTTNKMDAGPVLEYFSPLLKYLQEQNKDEFIGWKSNDSTICP